MKSKLKILIAFVTFSNMAYGPVFAAEKAVVYKSPTCGCCAKWEQHLRKSGFTVESRPTEDMNSVKDKNHVPEKARSCHTAVIGKYIIEGHVPADDIKKLLAEKPEGVTGLAAPGMPEGSPGMETGTVEHYDVVSFDSKGQTKVFSHH